VYIISIEALPMELKKEDLCIGIFLKMLNTDSMQSDDKNADKNGIPYLIVFNSNFISGYV